MGAIRKGRLFVSNVLKHIEVFTIMIDPILQHFTYAHLPERLQLVSKPFADLAEMISSLPDVEERRVALRKLLEAKDAAVRAKLADRPDAPPAIVETSNRA